MFKCMKSAKKNLGQEIYESKNIKKKLFLNGN